MHCNDVGEEWNIIRVTADCTPNRELILSLLLHSVLLAWMEHTPTAATYLGAAVNTSWIIGNQKNPCNHEALKIIHLRLLLYKGHKLAYEKDVSKKNYHTHPPVMWLFTQISWSSLRHFPLPEYHFTIRCHQTKHCKRFQNYDKERL